VNPTSSAAAQARIEAGMTSSRSEWERSLARAIPFAASGKLTCH
jgi:hypothetical protein